MKGWDLLQFTMPTNRQTCAWRNKEPAHFARCKLKELIEWQSQGLEMKRKNVTPGSAESIESLIHTVRGQKVILDADLARLYGVQTKAFNRAFKRHAGRFPTDFVFQLTRDEMDNLRCQSGTSSSGYGGRRYLPYAFTETGAVMSANILNSPQAVRMSVFVVRAFVRMREMLSGTAELARQLKELESKLTSRLDVHETAIVEVLQRIMDILKPAPEPPEPLPKEIGFHIKEDGVPYRIRRSRRKYRVDSEN